MPLDCAQQYRAAIAGAQLEVFDGAGHCVEMEEPERVAQSITSFAGR